MIMKAIRTSVFLGAVLLGVAAVATVSAWTYEHTGINRTGIPNDEVVWRQNAFTYWRNHTASSVQLNYTSHRVKYISGDYDSVNFHAMRNKVTNSESHTYFSDTAAGIELSTGETWNDKWKYGGGTGDDQYITASKADDHVLVTMTSQYTSHYSLTQNIFFYNGDDGDPAICNTRSAGFFQWITGAGDNCP